MKSQGEGGPVMEAGAAVMQLQAKEHQPPPEAGKREPRISKLQNWERIHFGGFKLPHLWCSLCCEGTSRPGKVSLWMHLFQMQAPTPATP